MARRRRLVVAITYAVSPPRGGGQSRVFHLYRELARWFDVHLVCLGEPNRAARSTKLGPGLQEHVVPKSTAHQRAEEGVSATVGGAPVTDITASRLIALTPDYLTQLDAVASGADVLVASHPYLTSLLVGRYPGVPLWLEAHNVETALKREMLPDGVHSDRLIGWVEVEERLAWRSADLVYACTRADLEALARRYGPAKGAVCEAPNGFAPSEVPFVPLAARAELRRRLGFAASPLVLFFGSWHGPNLDACERIVGYARTVPSAVFVVAGSAGHALAGRDVPSNLRLPGVVDEAEKRVLLSAADLAINPMESGSGSNLKMLDYLAAGIPVLSTPFGARGLGLTAGVHFEASPLSGFATAIGDFVSRPPADCAARCAVAAEMIRTRYTWAAIAESLAQYMQYRLGEPAAVTAAKPFAAP
ncbi:MAG: hypothetical protein RJA99_1670 [Pseudomonadota bacterium]